MIMRWISDVPLKMVKIVDQTAVSAGRWPALSGQTVGAEETLRWGLIDAVGTASR
jgi:enoyl-CoA hydratase/carnithine racemase